MNARSSSRGTRGRPIPTWRQIRREVLFALRLYERWQWPVLDVTYKSIEETATEVMRLIYARSGLKKGNIPY